MFPLLISFPPSYQQHTVFCHIINVFLPLLLGSLLCLLLSLHILHHWKHSRIKENCRVLENKCFQQTSSIKAINQARLDYSSLVSCGQQHWKPWRAIFIPLMKAMRNLQRLTLYKKRGRRARTLWLQRRMWRWSVCVCLFYLWGFMCVSASVYISGVTCNIKCRELWIRDTFYVSSIVGRSRDT